MATAAVVIIATFGYFLNEDIASKAAVAAAKKARTEATTMFASSGFAGDPADLQKLKDTMKNQILEFV